MRQKKIRLPAIEYIRGISMAGVVGIHVGSAYLTNPASNMYLTALFEIVTRFSVPIFFFISAFGMFYHLDLEAAFDYFSFLRRRLKTVLVPYLVWSVFYLWHDGIFYGVGFAEPLNFFHAIFFGTAKYQLYFMVILLWFYFLMPLWIFVVRRTDKKMLLVFFVLQTAFDYWSSYSSWLVGVTYGAENPLVRSLLMYRLNYWVLHYFFVFVLGGYLAVHSDEFFSFLRRRKKFLSLAFFLSLAAMLAHYFFLLNVTHYTQIEAVNTAHQLSPIGICYTVAASLFFFAAFTENLQPKFLNPLLSLCGRHSYFVYLAHPLAITWLTFFMERCGLIMTAKNALVFYVAVLVVTLAAAIVCRRAGNVFPPLNALTIGVWPKK